MSQEMQSGYRIHEWGGDLVEEEFPVPQPGPGEVGIEVEACGIGLTVLNCINGNLDDDPALLPRVPGHELVGRVVSLGSGVDPELGGQRVTAYFYLACGSCQQCSSGNQSLCENLDGWVGVHTDGGYAPHTVIPAYNAVVLPDDLDPEVATVVPDAVATPVHVCGRRARVVPGDRVVVIGAGGGVGAHMIQVAAAFGGDVVGFDITDDKLALIEELGARAFDSTYISAVDPTTLWSGGPPTVVIDLIGSTASLEWSAAALAVGGRLVVLTTFPDRRFSIDPREMVFRQLTLLGSRYASRDEVMTAANLVSSGTVKPVIGRRCGPDGVAEIHQLLREEKLRGRGVLSWVDAPV
ncbi:MAG: alcohol dehydrogenase catalytic domain-containing protein [Acidimicrobiia bacterium]|nr:alcohol dehydrogenase catalytic domain-containing protein [Acidimicrobiia bacterium]